MKMINNIKTLSLFIGLGLIFSCSSDSAAPEVNLPAKPTLSLPLNGENCSSYTVVANDETKAEISFSWASTLYATSYILAISDAGIEVVNKEITATSYKAVLDKGKTYTWTVTAKNSDGESTSVTNSFTTPGNPIGNYVPYAAIINFNVNSSNDNASLSWIGKDEDSNVSELKYDIEIKEDNIVILTSTNQAQSFIDDFVAKLNYTYQIKINTIDKYGSYSTSLLTYTYK